MTPLNRFLYQCRLRNGTALFLLYDRGLEHGPRDFFANSVAGGPYFMMGAQWCPRPIRGRSVARSRRARKG